jgi:hypothetical protein
MGLAGGDTSSDVDRAIGVPTAASHRVRQYCVAGGGAFAVVFNRRGVELVATSARGYALGGVAVGWRLRTLERTYRGGTLHAAGHGLLVAPNGDVYRIARDRVAAIAAASASVLKRDRNLAFALRLARL